jgi:hypothetical protein
VSLDIGNISFEDNEGDFNRQATPSNHLNGGLAHAVLHESDIEVQLPVFEGSKAKVTDSESPSNLPRMDSKISIHTGSSTPSLSAIKRKARPVATAAKSSPQPVYKSNALAWGVSMNSDADADSIPSTTTSTWTSTSVASLNASDNDADSESAPDHCTSAQQYLPFVEHNPAVLLHDGGLDAECEFQAPTVAGSSGAGNGALDAVASPSDHWGSLVDSATAKSPVSKFNASWCVPSPNRRRTSVTPSILHQGVQPSPFNNPAVFANSPQDSPMDISDRIDEDVTVNMGYYNPGSDVSMRTAKYSPFATQSPADMDISVDKEPAEVSQPQYFAGVHHAEQHIQFGRADSSSSAASSVTQGDGVRSVPSHPDFHQKSSSVVSGRGSFIAPKAAAAPRMDLLKELLAIRKKASPLPTPSPQFSRLASSGTIATSVLHEAAIKNASTFAPSREPVSIKSTAAPNFHDELRKRLSSVKANTVMGDAPVILQPTFANNGPKAQSPYVQKSVGELRKLLQSSKSLAGGPDTAANTISCKFISVIYFEVFDKFAPVPLREAVGRPSLDFTTDSPPNIKMTGL